MLQRQKRLCCERWVRVDTSVFLQSLAGYFIVFGARYESQCCDTRSLRSSETLWASSSTVVELIPPSVASVHYWFICSWN